MDSKPSDPNLSFVTAMYDPNDIYMQGNHQCTPDGTIDPAAARAARDCVRCSTKVAYVYAHGAGAGTGAVV